MNNRTTKERYIAWDLVAYVIALVVSFTFFSDYSHAFSRESNTESLSESVPVQGFYTRHGNRPVWMAKNGITPQGKRAIALLQHAGAHGLDPKRYHVQTIIDYVQHPKLQAEHIVAVDRLITSNIARFAQDLRYGVSTPQRIDRIGIQENRPALQATLAQLNPVYVEQFIGAHIPKSTHYAQLQRALHEYKIIAAEGGWHSIPAGKTLKPGMRDKRVATLRSVLHVTGDYDGMLPRNSTAANATKTLQYNPQNELYDDALVEAVKRFQKRHGLGTDGAVGPKTLRTLNVPVHERIEQIIATMERIRWLPDDLGNRYIIVNIPGYQLAAIEDNAVQLEMKVIVGKPSRRTPVFSNHITSAVFNPKWNVPRSIATKDILRKVQRDPSYLTRGGYRVTQHGEVIDPHSIDWSSITRGNFNFRFRQASGRSNALGKVKFPIPNNQAIFLHDTSNRGLFSKSERALSSGCIRVQKPLELAHFILQGTLPASKIDRNYNSTSNRHVKAEFTPVHSVYWTAWVGETGQPHFSTDIYNKDNKVIMALQEYQPIEFAPMQLASR